MLTVRALSKGEVTVRPLFSPGPVNEVSSDVPNGRAAADIPNTKVRLEAVLGLAGWRQRLLSGAMLKTYTH